MGVLSELHAALGDSLITDPDLIESYRRDRAAWAPSGVPLAVARPTSTSKVQELARWAKRVVDLAMTASGGAGMFKTNELERLYRDVRCGGFHPANTTLTHEIVGKTTLGIGLDEQPRWG